MFLLSPHAWESLDCRGSRELHPGAGSEFQKALRVGENILVEQT